MQLTGRSGRLWTLIVAAWLAVGAHDCVLSGLWLAEAQAAHVPEGDVAHHHHSEGGEGESVGTADCHTVAVTSPATSSAAPPVVVEAAPARAAFARIPRPVLPPERPAPEQPPRFLLHSALLI
jgi:hypothetical protein